MKFGRAPYRPVPDKLKSHCLFTRFSEFQFLGFSSFVLNFVLMDQEERLSGRSFFLEEEEFIPAFIDLSMNDFSVPLMNKSGNGR